MRPAFISKPIQRYHHAGCFYSTRVAHVTRTSPHPSADGDTQDQLNDNVTSRTNENGLTSEDFGVTAGLTRREDGRSELQVLHKAELGDPREHVVWLVVLARGASHGTFGAVQLGPVQKLGDL